MNIDTRAKLMSDTEVGAEAARTLSNVAVRAFFEREEAELVDQIIDAPCGDDGHAAREGLSAKLWALRSLKQSLEKAIAEADSAESMLRGTTAVR